MASPSFTIQTQLKDWILATIVMIPDYSDISLVDLDIDAWQQKTLELTADKLAESTLALKQAQEQLLRNQLLNLQARLSLLTDTKLEQEEAVIETSPQVVDKLKRASKSPENIEDSAIIETKTPKELAKDKEESLKQFLSTLP